MASKYLQSLDQEAYKDLTRRLFEIQNGQCFICCEAIDFSIQKYDVDHVKPLNLHGKDNEENLALTHDSCNRSKQDSHLEVARVLHRLKKLQSDVMSREGRPASLKDVLLQFHGSKYDFSVNFPQKKSMEFCFSDIGDEDIRNVKCFEDELSGELTAFVEAPLAYLYHDEQINPRGINSSINKLVKEFHKGNPQLHLSLARLHDGKLKIFDGQHKAVAQILLGATKLPIRVFLSPNVDRLTEANTNAGSDLRQIAFDKAVMRQLYDTLYREKVTKYQKDHSLPEDNFSFSERNLVDYFHGEYRNIKKLVTESVKHGITYSTDNKLRSYIDFEGKAKELPISHSAYDKSFMKLFVSKTILDVPLDHRTVEGCSPRELEMMQVVRLMNIVAEEVYIGRFDTNVGVFRIERKVSKENDPKITDAHLTSFRLSKEEVLYNWLIYLRQAIANYFVMTGAIVRNDTNLFQDAFPEQLWTNIRNFVRNLRDLPLWKDRSMASTIFSAKRDYNYWERVFATGKTPDNVLVLARPLNPIDMVQG